MSVLTETENRATSFCILNGSQRTHPQPGGPSVPIGIKRRVSSVYILLTSYELFYLFLMSESANPTLPWPCRRGRPRRACCPLAMWPSDRRCWRPSRSWTAPSPRLKCQMRKDWDWFHCKSRYEQNIYTHCVPLIWSSDIWYEYFRIYSQFLAGPERNRLSYNKCFGNPDIWLPIRLLCRVFVENDFRRKTRNDKLKRVMTMIIRD